MTDLTTPHAVTELRAEIGRKMVPLYVLAAAVGIHPTYVGQMLRGKRPMSAKAAEGLRRALDAVPTPEVNA